MLKKFLLAMTLFGGTSSAYAETSLELPDWLFLSGHAGLLFSETHSSRGSFTIEEASLKIYSGLRFDLGAFVLGANYDIWFLNNLGRGNAGNEEEWLSAYIGSGPVSLTYGQVKDAVEYRSHRMFDRHFDIPWVQDTSAASDYDDFRLDFEPIDGSSFPFAMSIGYEDDIAFGTSTKTKTVSLSGDTDRFEWIASYARNEFTNVGFQQIRNTLSFEFIYPVADGEFYGTIARSNFDSFLSFNTTKSFENSILVGYKHQFTNKLSAKATLSIRDQHATSVFSPTRSTNTDQTLVDTAIELRYHVAPNAEIFARLQYFDNSISSVSISPTGTSESKNKTHSRSFWFGAEYRF